jgi:hypothetical protein
MIMTNFAQRLKSVNFFQTTKFFQCRYQFSNTSPMFVQTFRSYFSEEIFLSSLSEWLSAQVYVLFKKYKKLINSNQNQNRKQTKNANKNEIFT